mmetsp:Transcript_14047/g.21512  ORF Transcript_14047/g.21512 Transcript_14047/m.21512 type:complete len:82 (+) Transcript_14047:76-321(+)
MLVTVPLKPQREIRGQKKNKGKKSQSSPYNGPLVAYLSKSPEYTGTDNPVGTATIRFNPDNSFLFLIDADGIAPDCVNAML